ncbi:MAG: sugar phosphate nucleotidyltransferase [Candidatus Latescibacterota bacterium]|jgi:mannose-1-phosphate guanylyltransferase
MKIVIRAGGIGTRLWPYSRKDRAKQFHALVGRRTMLQEAVERVASLVGPGELFVSTGADQVALVREQLPELPPEQLIVEPALRNTGPAVGLECALLEARFPGCVVASLGSDHYIGRPEEFARLLRVAEAALAEAPEALVTIGVRPTRVETGYGYIRKGAVRLRVGEEAVYRVEEFTEKPDQARARAYLESGRYLWNSNLFVWRARTVLNLLARFEPEIHQMLVAVQAAAGTPHQAETIARLYPRVREVAVDHALLERYDQVLALEAEIGWSDIGSWGALSDVLPLDDEGNLCSGNVLTLGSRQVTAYGPEGKVLVLVDVENLVVVDTGDALLVCPRDRTQRVKDVVAALQQDPERRRFI